MFTKFGCAITLIVTMLFAISSSGETRTNALAGKWPSIDEVRKKWDSVPLDKIRQAAEAGELTAQHYLGYSFASGERFGRNGAESVVWYERAMRGGYLPSASNLGRLYTSDEVIPKDLAKAVRYMRVAAEGGFAAGQANLGIFYRDGIGVQQDNEEALRWFQRAAEAGNPLAQCEMGYNSEFMDWTTYHESANSNNMPVAIQWYRRSAEQNWPGGQYRLGLCYLAGKGAEKDEEQGLELIRKAADQNHAYALFKLAKLYRNGVGEPRNESDRPIKLLLRSAGLDCRLAYAELSDRYRSGLGCECDLIKSGQWHSRAGAAGISGFGITDAKINYADATPTGDPFGVALSLYLKAIQRNDQSAMVRIGDMYLAGNHVPKDVAEAWAWLRLAADQGHSAAREKLSEIETQMTPQQLQSANERSGELKHYQAGKR